MREVTSVDPTDVPDAISNGRGCPPRFGHRRHGPLQIGGHKVVAERTDELGSVQSCSSAVPGQQRVHAVVEGVG